MFARVGTPRRWLWPVFALLRDARILTPGWEHDVPFTVVNRAGRDAVLAARTFQLRSGVWTMVDRIGISRGRLVDDLGERARIRAELVARVDGGALILESTRALVRIGVIRVPIPFAPRVHLTESFDDLDGRQHVHVTLEAPIIGTLYEYEGSFTYSIEETTA